MYKRSSARCRLGYAPGAVTRTCDVAVIGAGSAGIAAHRAARLAGARAVLIDGGPSGTTCARVGCMPSKLLVAAGEAAHAVARAGEFGIRVPDGVRVDAAAVLGRVRRERDRFVAGVLEALGALAAGERVCGRARFVGPTALALEDGTHLDARAVVIATGSRSQVPALLEPVRERVLTSDDVFELTALPSSVAVLGAGPIGLELGQALARLGVRVTICDRLREVGGLRDPAVAAAARDALGAELAFALGVTVTAEPRGDGVRLWLDGEGGRRPLDVERVLAATGRGPNVDALGLAATGLACDDRGVPLHDAGTGQCGTSPVFVAGDAGGGRAILHEAVDDGRIAGRNAARFPDLERPRRRTPLAIVFTEPQLAMVGERFDALDRDAVAFGAADFATQGRARVMARNRGLVRVWARRDDTRLVGGELAVPDAEHLAHLLAWAIQAECTVEEALAMPWYHPVVEEGLRSAIRELAAATHSRPPERPQDLECGPGVCA
ncbi:MAG: dihydrolipoyl dehydrogenase [bacterium]|nr:dihydrolipoyl dehydrogenase [bacterium]